MNTLRNLLLMLCIGPVFFEGIAGQTPVMYVPEPGELDEKELVAKAIEFLKAGRVQVPADSPKVKRLSNPTEGLPGAVSVVWSTGLGLNAETALGQVQMFQNRMRQESLEFGQPKTIPHKQLATKVGVQVYMNGLASRFGLKKGQELVSLVLDDRRDGPFKGITASAQYQEKPYGYRLWNSFGKVAFTIDRSDGTLLSFSRYPPYAYTVESHLKKLDQATASKAALRVAKARELDTSPPLPPGVRPSAELMLVRPNGKMGGVAYPVEPPGKLRLAWVIRYGRIAEEWIDAADGKCLGGVDPKDFRAYEPTSALKSALAKAIR